MAMIDQYPDSVEQEFIRITDYKTPYFAPGQLHLVENFGKATFDHFQGWHLHHRLELNPDGTQNKTRADLIVENLYFCRPAEELIFLTAQEHLRMHGKANGQVAGTYKASAETKAKQSEAKLKANNTEARYAVVSAMVERGETLSFTDYAFYRRYCKRNGIPFVGAKVNKNHTLTRVDVPLVEPEPSDSPTRADLQRERFRKAMRTLRDGNPLPRLEYTFLVRYCTRRGINLPDGIKVDYGNP